MYRCDVNMVCVIYERERGEREKLDSLFINYVD